MRHRSSGGFVLLAVLAALVVMTLLATAIATTAERAIEEQRAAESQLDARLAMHGTEATALYLLATQRVTFGGLTIDESEVRSEDEITASELGLSFLPVGNELPLDGTHLRGVGPARFALQDDRGLISPGWINDALRARMVALLGGDPLRVSDLYAKLLDYQDEDDLTRLNGAEAEEYLDAGKPPPPNRPLSNPLELRRVMGWDVLLANLDDATIAGLFTLGQAPAINVNTATPWVLQALFGTDESTARRVVALREASPFLGSHELWRSTGLVAGEDGEFMVFPGTSGTLSVWAPGGGQMRLTHWTLTPVDDGGAPWRSEYVLYLPSPSPDPRLDALAVPPAPIFSDPPAAAR